MCLDTIKSSSASFLRTHAAKPQSRVVSILEARGNVMAHTPETRLRLSAKRTSPFKSAEASVQSTTGSPGVRISGSNAGYTMFRGSVKGTGYPLHSPVSPSIPLPCVTVCHHISTAVYPKVKVKFTLEQATKVQRKSRDITLRFIKPRR